MKIKLLRLLILCVLGIISANTLAQDEYKAEIGVSGGGSYYLGDANSQLFKNMQLAVGGFFRYKFDPRFALKVEIISTKVVAAQNTVNNSLYSTDFCGEFNFFDLEENQYKQFSKKFSPYIFTGVGIMTDMYDGQKFPGFLSLPFGVGIKVKLASRWNFNAQWTNRLLLFSDNMENNPIYNNTNNLNGTNVLNNDLLSTLTVGLSFDFWEKSCNCLNNNFSK
ncbi:MAG: DUF6089 family protein [Paludibacter sp.]|nr:DUF6089 family protein [Paludibacter sp.]